jgi:hypothetical protein
LLFIVSFAVEPTGDHSATAQGTHRFSVNKLRPPRQFELPRFPG